MNQNNHIRKELAELNSQLANTERKWLYALPAGYFDTLAETVLKRIKAMENASEEIAFISPLLSRMKKQVPYEVPAGYFESLRLGPKARIVSMFQTRWFRMAAAAMIIGLLALTGFYILNSRISEKEPMAKFSRDIMKLDDVQKVKMIDFIDAGMTGKEQAINNAEIKTNEIRDLLHGIPESELKAFQEQTEDINDVLMNN